MNEQKRMEKFYDTYAGEGGTMLRPLFVWDKDEDDNYLAPVARLLWAGWQAAQFGQLSFKFDLPTNSFGEK